MPLAHAVAMFLAYLTVILGICHVSRSLTICFWFNSRTPTIHCAELLFTFQGSIVVRSASKTVPSCAGNKRGKLAMLKLKVLIHIVMHIYSAVSTTVMPLQRFVS